MLDTIISIIFFYLGAIIGSFLNVVALRYRTGRTLSGRSGCYSCGRTLTWHELVPIGSFLTQRGKCFGCNAKISWQYPIVEALTGVLFVLLYSRFAYLLPYNALLFGILFIFYAVIFSALIVLSVYDIKHKILPNKIVGFFVFLSILSMFFVKGDAVVLHIPEWVDIFAGIIIPLPFALIWLVSKGKWMGLGDSKLMAGIGFWLGMSSGITAVLFSFWIGAILSLILIFCSKIFGKGKVSLMTAIPFGPFLVVGSSLVFLFNLNFDFIMQIFSVRF